MASYYSVVQIAPGAAFDERVNIGVLAFNEVSVRANFITNWRRAAAFIGEDLHGVEEFASHTKALVDELGTFPGATLLTPDDVREMAAAWSGSIRLTPPRVSTLSVERLITTMSTHHLPADRGSGRAPRHRTKADLTGRAHAALHREFARRPVPPGSVIVPNDVVAGRLRPHKVDLAVRAGGRSSCLLAISFAAITPGYVEDRVSLAAFAVEDVRRLDDAPEFAVAVDAPAQEMVPVFNDAKRTFRDLGLRVISEGEIEDWAEREADLVAPLL